MRWPQERSGELLDGLLALVRVAAKTRGPQVPAVVVEMIESLSQDCVSVGGNAVGPSGIVVQVSEGMTADEAGADVGLTGARVRQLCRAGLVLHTLHAGRYLVDPADLRRHLRGDVA